MKSKILKSMFSLLMGASLIVVLNPTLRSSLRSHWVSDRRVVLSSLQADLSGDGASFTVVKVRANDKLLLEVYTNPSTGSLQLAERVQLPDTHDGYFNFSDHAANLAVADLDGNGQQQILAPSFDNDLVGHLNVYQFDPTTHGLNRVVR